MSAGWPVLAGALAVGYALGAIPFGFLLTRFAGLGDVRAIGSGNIGATNVLRTGRKGLAAATLVGDALKGTLAVLLAARFGGPEAGLAGALGAVLGHLFPVWLGFRGGKGVATFVGCLIAVSPAATLVFALAWLGLALGLRYSSAASLAATALTPVALALLGPREAAILFLGLAALLWFKHAANIRRLAAGTESRIGGTG